ncbi:DUF3313 domain-containing protein [Vibrio sp. HN007]|uniref:DUF3313 domain-containing protein n=1 Tax=Vibrio iocasae TaxID=3098914 RepID=UPI0035D4CB12
MSINKMKILFAALLVSVVSGCANVSQDISSGSSSVSLKGLTQDKSKMPTLVYERKGAKPLSEYNSFIIDPIKVDYDGELSQEDLAELQQYFQKAMTDELTEAGYEVRTTPTPDTLRVSFRIFDIKTPTALVNVTSLVVPGTSATVGEVSIEAVFSNAEMNQVDAVILEHSRGSYLFNANPYSNIDDIEYAFDNWARGFTRAVNTAKGK